MVGGLLRNAKRRIDIAFSRLVVDFPILVAEFMVKGSRIRLVKSRNIWNTKVESDVIQVVQASMEKSTANDSS